VKVQDIEAQCEAMATITLGQVRQWCEDYDACMGEYAENGLEGWSVWEYIQHRANGLPVRMKASEWTAAPKDWRERAGSLSPWR
jgi:hypothetical protein